MFIQGRHMHPELHVPVRLAGRCAPPYLAGVYAGASRCLVIVTVRCSQPAGLRTLLGCGPCGVVLHIVGVWALWHSAAHCQSVGIVVQHKSGTVLH
jgi:hypothetical protein